MALLCILKDKDQNISSRALLVVVRACPSTDGEETFLSRHFCGAVLVPEFWLWGMGALLWVELPGALGPPGTFTAGMEAISTRKRG